MARTKIDAQELSPQGVTPTYEAANIDGNSVAIRAGRSIRFRNSGAAAVNVTLVTPLVVSGIDVPDVTVSVPTGGDGIEVGKLGAAFRQVDATVHIDYADSTVITVAVVDA